MSHLPRLTQIEPLEARIAPASINYIAAPAESPILLKAGEGLATAGDGGQYLLYVEKGQAIIFTSDFNKNGRVDYNEITGVAAGNGLRLVSFVDIHGDIVTNLRSDGTLSDSDNNASNDNPALKGDGRVLLNSVIEKIELRTLATTDITDQNGDSVVNDTDVALRAIPASHSIYGNIIAGGGFGVKGDATSGLLIGSAGYGSLAGVKPSIGSILAGTAGSNTFFSFGTGAGDSLNPTLRDIGGRLLPFVPTTGQAGAGIYYVRAADPELAFNLDGLEAGDGGFGAAGGNIENVTLFGDSSGGYTIRSGNGGQGFTGGNGGSIISFSDLGSTTGRVIIDVGDGGVGLTGAGGAAGAFTFGTLSFLGDVTVTLGDGGDGFTGGSNGGSLSAAVFNTPPTDEVKPGVGAAAAGTTREVGDIGRTKAIDFDGDGIGDFVYTARDVGKVFVALSSFSFFTITLPTLDNPGPIAVGDFNGDGRPDIAVGFAAERNATSIDNDRSPGKIAIYLSRYSDSNGDSILDRFGIGIDPFGVGRTRDAVADGFFERARYATLPSMESFLGQTLPQPGPAIPPSPIEIIDIEVGNFDNDSNGILDLGVLAEYENTRILFVLSGDDEVVENVAFTPALGGYAGPTRTGLFYSDFGEVGNVKKPFVVTVRDADRQATVGADSIVATAAALGDSYDILLSVNQNNRAVYAYDFSGGTPVVEAIALGQVDTDREISPINVSLTDAFAFDVAVGDFDGNGNADLAVLANDGVFLVTFQGDGTGVAGFTLASGSGDNAGIHLKEGPGSPGLPSGFNPGQIIGITDDQDATPGHVFVFDAEDEKAIKLDLSLFNAATQAGSRSSVGAYIQQDSYPFVFDLYVPDATPGGVGLYEFALVNVDPTGPSPIGVVTSDGFYGPYLSNFLGLKAGNGGDSINGAGGAGGSFGNGSINLSNPLSAAFQIIHISPVSLTAGNGGNGYTRGGDGGFIGGVYATSAEGFLVTGETFSGGSGGNSIKGKGGNGGDVFNLVHGNGDFYGGAGGKGRTGGSGGSIFSIVGGASESEAIAGNGGDGIRGGGAGGGVADFSIRFPETSQNPVSRDFTVAGGNGGNAVAGAAGAGGSLFNILPSIGENYIGGFVTLLGGNGGSGLSGGLGGSITTLVNVPTGGVLPTAATVHGGDGGDGITGNGGKGGNITGVRLSASALILDTAEVLINQFIAGVGGLSSGAKGGNGGDVSAIDTVATRGSAIAAGGDGGDGLTKGGKGGSVIDALVNASRPTGEKVLVVGGKGGDAYASTVAEATRLGRDAIEAFGGTNGKGGNGGSIINFTQPATISTRVDLIAGNGGDTVHTGLSFDNTTLGGKGGSIKNATVAGSVGNIASGAAIKAYSGAGFGYADSVAGFIASVRNGDDAVMTDDDGNVGLVAGAAGRLYLGVAATAGVTGSVNGLQARNIMSMVAGGVDQIVAIQKITKLNITLLTGDKGSDKGAPIPGATLGLLDYLDANGNPIPAPVAPVLGGALVDGAIIAKSLPKNLAGDNVVGTRIFVL